jgi:uncharacterized membrane protein YbhN (UPF0104 family)
MDKRNLKIILNIVISCLFIGYLSFKVDISALVVTIGSIDIGLYVISTFLAVFSGIIVAVKYYFLVKGSSFNHSLASLVKINFIARFYALFLPSAIGREVVRWIKVTRNRNGKAQFLASIVFERLTFLMVLLFCGMIPLFFYKSNPEIEILRMRVLPIAAIGIFLVSMFIVFYIYQPLRDLIKSLTYLTLQRIRPKLNVDSYFENHHLKKMNANIFASILGLSIIWQLFFICRLLVLMKAASVPLGFMDITWIGSLVLLLQTIPISFAGIGLREGAYAYLFALFNLPPEKGVLIGILFFSQMLVIAFVGGILELFE